MTTERQPLSLADAEMITRTRHLGWDSGTYAEAQDLRLAAMREGLSPQAFDQDAPEYRAAIRRAHLMGVAGGLVLAFVCLVIGIALYDAINTNWPVACDGTAALPSCAARILGALT